MIRFTASAITVDAAANAETPSRTISGLAVPYNVDAVVNDGRRVRIVEGALPEDGRPPRLIMQHDADARSVVGIVTERVSTSEGMMFTAEIANTSAGNDLLELLRMGALDSVSVGLTPKTIKAEGRTDVVTSADWEELSVVYAGAFSEAKIYKVSASEPDEVEEVEETPTDIKENQMSQETPTVEASAEIVPTAPIFASAKRHVEMPTPAEYLIAAARGDMRVIEAANNGTADVPGILPQPLVQNVFDSISSRRRFIDAVGTYAAPNAEMWYRRKVTQHTSVAEQAAQFDTLSSQALEINKMPVYNKLLGGTINLSEQVIDWSEPAMLQLTINDMVKMYNRATELDACTTLVDGVSATVGIVDWTDGDEIIDALYDSSVVIDGVLDELPTHVFLSADRWASLGKAKEANGNRILPTANPTNAAGTMNPGTFTINGLGLTFVVSSQFEAGTMVLGNPMGIELYEQPKGVIQVLQPSNASVSLAVRGYFAGLVIEPGAFVKFVND